MTDRSGPAHSIEFVEDLQLCIAALTKENKLLKELNSGKLMAYDAMKETLDTYAVRITGLTMENERLNKQLAENDDTILELQKKYDALTNYVNERKTQ